MKTVIILFFFLIISFSVFAQNSNKAGLTDEEINELSSRLSMKLILNDSQKSSVKNYLKTFSTEIEKINSGSAESTYKNVQELTSKINSQIESLLDSKQKIKYDVLEKDWWTSVNAEAKD